MLSWYQAQLDDTNNTQHTKITVQAASSIMNSTHDTTPPLDTASTPSYRRTTSLFFVFFSPLLCFMNQQLRIECWLCSTPNLTTMIQLPTLSQHIDSLFLPQIPSATSTKPPDGREGNTSENPLAHPSASTLTNHTVVAIQISTSSVHSAVYPVLV